jgi:hypothetical protein
MFCGELQFATHIIDWQPQELNTIVRMQLCQGRCVLKAEESHGHLPLAAVKTRRNVAQWNKRPMLEVWTLNISLSLLTHSLQRGGSDNAAVAMHSLARTLTRPAFNRTAHKQQHN